MTEQFRLLLERSGHSNSCRLAKGRQLFNCGDKTTHVYWLEQGLLCAYFVTAEGKEFCKEFYWQGDVIYGMRSLLGNEPLPYSVVALEPCNLLRLSIAAYRTLTVQEHQWADYHRQQLEQHLLIKERKEAFLLLKTPEQRVFAFHRDYDFLLHRIKDYQIASYLAMTPISYSRIKKRLNLT
ncbi:cAMP-binding protein [Shewanella psychrophila]|uniref:cAMP-binding protein n=1 Tax=Shewanella psychrophila TaxID=225848 RepID=A0A1S6HT33_9GAMM|nr:Crp/Fnr family transcriptional regulator [Shewanella psychrophila]AQS38659.1 cAMP-binding protein [Shewanella psychrophila]